MTVFWYAQPAGPPSTPASTDTGGHAGGAGGNATSNAPGNHDGRSGAAGNGADSEPSFTSATRPALSAAAVCERKPMRRNRPLASPPRTSYRTSSSDARRTTNMPPLRAARAPRLTARRKNSVMPLASTLMAWTSEPLACPHCEAQIHAYEDVLTLFLSRVELIVVGCAACRKVLGVLPPAKVDYWPMFGRRRWALRWFPVRRKAFRGADLPGRAGLPGGARGESLPAGTRPQDTA